MHNKKMAKIMKAWHLLNFSERRVYFDILKLSHDPARNGFLHLLTLPDGLPARTQKEIVLNICPGSIHHLSGISGPCLQLLCPVPVPSRSQSPGRVPGIEAAPCPSTSSLLAPCQEHVSSAGARLVLEKLLLMTSL